MKMSLTVLAAFGTLVCLGFAQEPVPEGSNPGTTNDPVAHYGTLNRRLVEFKAQADCLNQVAQEHKRRADVLSRDQPARAQWENELAKELQDQAATLLVELSKTRNEQLALEKTYPDLAGAGRSLGLAAPGRSSDELAFLAKLQERAAAVQAELAAALDAGNVYAAQLMTNKAPADFSRMTFLIQQNGNAVKRLQNEADDLELRRLEFRALRGE